MGEWIYRRRWLVAAAWAAVAVGLWALGPRSGGQAGLTSDLLPADSPSRQGLAEMQRRFGSRSGLSHVVVVFERSGGALTGEDQAWIESFTARVGLPRPGGAEAGDLRDVEVLGAYDAKLRLLGKLNPLVSGDGRAAMVTAALPHEFATAAAVRVVEHVHAALAEKPLPAGLAAAVTGEAGYGRDHLLANERSHDKILGVTIAAVVLILLAVYRAPLAALVPLAAIGLASLAATALTAVGRPLGLGSGTAERLFMLVLLYGAGVDYSLLFISRYRELLEEGRTPEEAFTRGLAASVPAIAASAVVTAAALACLCFARLGVFRDVGPAIVLALLVAAGASLTLTPALVAAVGPRLFWPRSPGPALPSSRRRFWPAAASLVVGHPGWVLAVTLAGLFLPARAALRPSLSFDAEASLSDRYDAVRGMKIVSARWSVGQLAPVTVLVSTPTPLPPEKWRDLCRDLAKAFAAVDGVAGVRRPDNPLGRPVDPATETLFRLNAGEVAAQFIAPDRRAVRLDALLANPPQSAPAILAAETLRLAANHVLAEARLDAEVFLTGPTAATIDLRDLTRGDFFRTAALALAVLLVLTAVFLRDVPLSLFLAAATALGYASTLGLTAWLFQAAGTGPIDWEVQVFLFIVLVAVGQDYNLFLTVRLAQESASLPPRAAVRQALVATGPVISSCGLIMAATLGSLLAADVRMLQQLGFALALGMLLDTFLIRPLLLPAFCLLAHRTLKNAPAFLRDQAPPSTPR